MDFPPELGAALPLFPPDGFPVVLGQLGFAGGACGGTAVGFELFDIVFPPSINSALEAEKGFYESVGCQAH